jgi:hypothetical protein
VLAGASVAGVLDQQDFNGVSRSTLYSLVVRSPHYDGVTPVGALGVPIRTLWHMAATMMEPKGDSAERVADVIGGLARRYDDTMQQAMANDYLWQNAAAPVDVGSFDIASIAMNASRVFGPDRMEGALERVLGGLPSMGRGQIEMALELARAADEEGWRP